jgi:hypothetical protein
MSPRASCKCCAHLPREERATRGVTFGRLRLYHKLSNVFYATCKYSLRYSGLTSNLLYLREYKKTRRSSSTNWSLGRLALYQYDNEMCRASCRDSRQCIDQQIRLLDAAGSWASCLSKIKDGVFGLCLVSAAPLFLIGWGGSIVLYVRSENAKVFVRMQT